MRLVKLSIIFYRHQKLCPQRIFNVMGNCSGYSVSGDKKEYEVAAIGLQLDSNIFTHRKKSGRKCYKINHGLLRIE